MYAYLYTYILYIHTYTCICIITHIYIQLRYTYMYIYTMHAYIYIYIHTCTYIYMHIYTCIHCIGVTAPHAYINQPPIIMHTLQYAHILIQFIQSHTHTHYIALHSIYTKPHTLYHYLASTEHQSRPVEGLCLPCIHASRACKLR